MTETEDSKSERRGHPVRVGDLARAAGTTVRTLHHYEEVGLLEPTRDPASGHRLYSKRDIQRLQKVQLLRGLGLSLTDIAAMLDGSGIPFGRIIRLHRARLEDRKAEIGSLLLRLDAVEARLGKGGRVATDELFSLMEAITMFEKHYTPEQLDELRKRREALGDDRIRQGQQDWTDLIAQVRSAVEEGTPPDSDQGRELAARWQSLIEQFTGGNSGIRDSLQKAYAAEPGSWDQFGIDKPMREWIGRASKGS